MAMNWTGGSRARNNKPSSNKTRLQKRYFAKVRAQNSVPLTHTDPHLNPGNGTASLSRKRKKARIPDLDIILPKDGTQLGGPVKKRRLIDTSEYFPLPGGMGTVTSTYSAPSFGNGNQGSNGFKTKKQLLLEKDDWVCTALSRPLVLGRKSEGPVNIHPAVRKTVPELSTHHEQLSGCLDCDRATEGLEGYAGEAQEPNYSHHHTLERTSVGPVGNGQVERKNFGRGAFRSLSDGGYVQIGGSTQSGSSNFDRRGSLGREMSHISEDTMLFDLEGQPGRYISPSPLHNTPVRNSNLFRRKYQIYPLRERPENTIYNLNEWNVHQDRHGIGGLPSSPLAPYSQNINNRRFATPNDFLASVSTDSERDTIEEIDAATADIVSSSPSTILSTVYVRPGSVNSPLPWIPPVAAHDQENREYQPKPHQKYLTDFQSTSKIRTGLNRLLEEDSETTQNISLVAYASSSGSLPTEGDEGEEWILGSNTPPEPCRGLDTTDCIPAQECKDDWERFLKDQSANEVKAVGAEQDIKNSEAQKYLEEVGIWERHSEPEDMEEVFIEVHNNQEDDDKDNQPTVINNPEGSRGPGPARPVLWPESENEEAPWREFVTRPSVELGDTDHTKGSGFIPRKSNAVNRCSGSIIMNPEMLGGNPVEPVESKSLSSERLRTVLELDKDEDSAWRMFVFGGLGEIESEGLEPLEPPESTSCLPKLPSQSTQKYLRTAPLSPEPQLPGPPGNPSLDEPFYAPSMAGATVGSGSAPDSETNSSATDSSPARRISKLFNPNTLSSPVASPVSLVPTRPYRLKSMVPIGWRGGSNLYSTRRGRSLREGGKAKTVQKKERKNRPEDEIEDI